MKMKTVYDDMRSPIESLLQFLLRLKTTWCCLQCNDDDDDNGDNDHISKPLDVVSWCNDDDNDNDDNDNDDNDNDDNDNDDNDHASKPLDVVSWCNNDDNDKTTWNCLLMQRWWQW